MGVLGLKVTEPWNDGARVKLFDGREGDIDGPGYLQVKKMREEIVSYAKLMVWAGAKRSEEAMHFWEEIKKL